MSQKPLNLTTEIKLNVDGDDYNVVVRYELKDASNGEFFGAANVYTVFAKDDNLTIAQATANGIERARQVLSEIVSRVQSDPQS